MIYARLARQFNFIFQVVSSAPFEKMNEFRYIEKILKCILV